MSARSVMHYGEQGEMTRHSKIGFCADDLVAACRVSVSQREEELEEESSRHSMCHLEKESMSPSPLRDPYPVDPAEDHEVKAAADHAKVDFAAQFRAARARVAEEERKVKTDEANKVAKSITRMNSSDDDKEEGSTEVIATTEAAPSAPVSDNVDVVSLCAKLEAASPDDLGLQSTLRADHRGLGVGGARGLAVLLDRGDLQALEVLTLSQNSLTDSGIAILADVLRPSVPLTHLDLASNSFADLGATAVAQAFRRGALPTLATLSLKNNDIGSKALATIANTSHPTLNWLNLSGNQISDALPLTEALRAGRFPHLRRLSLDHNLLDDDCMRSLANALATPTDAGLTRLGLDELYVECNPASAEATQAVQACFLLDEGDDRTATRERSSREICETVSVSLYRCLGGSGPAQHVSRTDS